MCINPLVIILVLLCDTEENRMQCGENRGVKYCSQTWIFIMISIVSILTTLVDSVTLTQTGEDGESTFTTYDCCMLYNIHYS